MIIIISIGAALILVGVGIIFIDNNYLYQGIDMLGVLLILIALVFTPLTAITWHSAKVKADMVNDKYGTEYTASDFFFAGETIENMIEGTTHNINIKKENENE